VSKGGFCLLFREIDHVLRQTFDQKQRRLQDKLLVLGSQVEVNLAASINGLKQRDVSQTKALLADGRAITKGCAAVETDTLALLATQQPMAGDLRFLAAVLQIALELQRIGDHAREIAEISMELGNKNLPEPYMKIVHMADLAGTMLHQAMTAFIQRDVVLAQAVSARDNDVDDLYSYTCQQLRDVVKANRHVVAQAIALFQIAHQLERVADRTTNICEWAVFAVTGEIEEININQEP
jgi:phosphate transport system protein